MLAHVNTLVNLIKETQALFVPLANSNVRVVLDQFRHACLYVRAAASDHRAVMRELVPRTEG